MSLFDQKRIKTKKQAQARIDELHSTVINRIDLLGIVPRGSKRTPGDTAKQDQALAEIRELQKSFGIETKRLRSS